jgi:hypothetical protein
MDPPNQQSSTPQLNGKFKDDNDSSTSYDDRIDVVDHKTPVVDDDPVPLANTT